MSWLQRIGLFLAAIPATLAGFILCVLRPFHRRNNKLCARLYARGGLRVLNMRVRVEGWQHLPRDDAHVIIANHQSNLDLYVYGQVTPENAVVVGKQSLGWVPLFGQIFWLGGNVLIRRSSRRHAMSAMEAAKGALSHQKKSVWIMPEGTRSRGRGLLPFKKGAFHTAVAAGKPITVLCVSDYLRALNERRPGERVTATVRVLPPISTENLSVEDVPALMTRCRTLMEEHLESLNGNARSGQAGRKNAA